MEAYQVLLLILVLISFGYISVAVYGLGHMGEFRRRLWKRLRGLNLLMYKRAESLLEIVELFRSRGVTFSSEDEECFTALRKLNFDVVEEKKFRAAVDVVKSASSRLKFIAGSHPKAASGAIYAENNDLLEDLERNYRIYIGQYNMDVVGYNYWITVPTLGWLGFIFGHRAKTFLS